MLAQTNRDLAFHEERAAFVEKDLERVERRLAQAGDNPSLKKQAGEMRATLGSHKATIETLKRHADLFAQPAKQIHFAAETQVGGSEASKQLHRHALAGMRLEFPELAENLQKNGYIKKLIVGEEPYRENGWHLTKPMANGLAEENGSVYLRRIGKLRSYGDPTNIWESASVRSFQTEPHQASLALVLHEVAHQYHFNRPELGQRLHTLFARAKRENRMITERADVNPVEYFAESVAATLMHPHELDNRDPEMGDFVKNWLVKEGIRKP